MMFPLGNPANSIKAALGKPPGALASGLLTVKPIRRFGAKPDKKIVDRQAASPSSWKTPFIATWIAW
jgi:hypothetical protein